MLNKQFDSLIITSTNEHGRFFKVQYRQIKLKKSFFLLLLISKTIKEESTSSRSLKN